MKITIDIPDGSKNLEFIMEPKDEWDALKLDAKLWFLYKVSTEIISIADLYARIEENKK